MQTLPCSTAKQGSRSKRILFLCWLTMTTQNDKQQIMFEYYEGLLSTAAVHASTLDLAFFHRQGMDLSALDGTITEEDVSNTIKTLPADRALGLDGYTRRFNKACWQIIKHHFMAAIIKLQHGDSRKLWLLNSA